MLTPAEPDCAPSKWSEGADGNSWPETNRPPNKKAGTRSRKYDIRIVGGNVVVARRHWQDFNVAGSDRYLFVLIAAQIAVIVGHLTLMLHSIHNVIALCQHSVAKLLSPAHVGSHHLQHLWKRQKAKHAWIERQAIGLNSRG